MSLTENSDQVFLPGGCNRTQNLRFGPYTKFLILKNQSERQAIELLFKVQISPDHHSSNTN